MLHAAFLSLLWHPLGLCAGTHAQIEACRSYNWWSGIAGDFGEVAIIGGIVTLYRRWNCSAPWCWRHGKHPTADGLHRLCRKHHPDLPDRPLSLDEIRDRHEAAKP